MKKIIFYIFVSCMSLVWAADIIVPAAPIDWRVLDEVSLLTESQKSKIEQKIAAIEKETQHEIGIAILNDLQGREIEEISLAIARTWGIGKKGLDNWLLIVIAPANRTMRIEVGRGLEWVITDLITRRVREEYMAPKFREDDYYDGILSALDILHPLLSGEIVNLPEPPADILGVFVTFIIFLVYGGIFLGSVFFEKSKAWWPGIMIGIILWGGVLWVLVGTVIASMIGMIVAWGILGWMDYVFSTGKIRGVNSRPHGGRWWGGGSGGFGWWGGFWGGWGGGFGGGWFGWGGSSGRW